MLLVALYRDRVCDLRRCLADVLPNKLLTSLGSRNRLTCILWRMTRFCGMEASLPKRRKQHKKQQRVKRRRQKKHQAAQAAKPPNLPKPEAFLGHLLSNPPQGQIPTRMQICCGWRQDGSVAAVAREGHHPGRNHGVDGRANRHPATWEESSGTFRALFTGA